ncbi:MAG TPA: hypothetical protein VKS25_00440, partial [Solirubrobacteraceae bacterium]|nr:hypothetical protein [Solirubrobacteraceae bacterium]
MSEDPTRTPFSALRASTPAADDEPRARAREILDEHVAAAGAAEPARRRRRRPMPRTRWIASLGAAAVVAGGGVTLAAILLRTDHTGHLPVFTAQGTLSPRFHVADTGSGYCFTDSLATEARDAYRCIQGNALHDPCFAASTRARSVVCFLDPWHPVTLLRLTRPLPRHGPVPKLALPWAIITSDGRHCTFLTGATAPMGGERINYGCVAGSYLIGTPDRRNPLWTIRSARAYVPDQLGHP